MTGIDAVVDLTPALSGVTGVARYALRLYDALPSAGVRTRAFAIGRGAGDVPAGTRHIGVPFRAVQPLWRFAHVPRAEWLAGGGDLVHSVDLLLPPTRRPLIATVHDVAALDRPDLHPPAVNDWLRRRIESLAQTDGIVSVSRATADSLQRWGITSVPITITPLAPTLDLGRAVAGQPARPGGYLLAVGELTARKDFPTLIRAMAEEPCRDLRLVMAGPMGYRGDEVTALVAKLGLESRVEILGRVPDATLAELYLGASALCFTSVIEGFGIPLVEAMAAGLPIVASDIDVAHEVAGEAAIYAAVGDAVAFAEAIGRVTSDADLHARLAATARERGAGFTWQATAAATASAYRQALGCT